MAGKPKRAKIIADLQRLAARAEVDSPLAYVELMLQSGMTVLDICSDISETIKERVYAGTLSRILADIDTAGNMEALLARLREARRLGAASLAEEAVQVADQAEPTPGSVARARARGDARFRLAEAFDRSTFGSKAAAGLTLNIGALHLDALRAANVEAKQALARVNAQLLTPTEVISDV